MQRLKFYQARVEHVLDLRLPASRIHPQRLHAAMRHAALGPGKRLRPALVYAAGHALGAPLEALDAPACAVELIHAYSLVHDDLPAMDDDDMRRGRPACHRAYDEATAILAGDALQTLAFHVLAHDDGPQASAPTRLAMIVQLAQAAGSRGMAGGQAIDLETGGQTLSLAELEDLHIHKTGALIRCSVLLGALSAAAAPSVMEYLDRYAQCLGLAFQIQDDLLDSAADNARSTASTRPTYPGLLGENASRRRVDELYAAALAALSHLEPQAADPLHEIARHMVARRH